MILTLDIGNTNIKTALFDGSDMKCYWRISTNRSMSSDEYGILLANLFQHNNMRMDCVTGIMMSSVVPSVNFTIEHMCRNYFHMDPLMVAPGIKTGINIKSRQSARTGQRPHCQRRSRLRIVWRAVHFHRFRHGYELWLRFGQMGFLGGAICPGLKLSAEALVENAAKLPKFELVKPESAIGRSTITNLQSGIVFGHVGLVTYLIGRMREELGAPKAKVVATGGLALLVSNESDVIDVLDGLLTLKGLRLIYERNVGA